jgi:hypothetical protein
MRLISTFYDVDTMQSLNTEDGVGRNERLVAKINNLLKLLTLSTAEVVYLDTEYIHAALAENRYRPTDQDWKEVVQIGAVKWNHATHKATDSFVRLVRPKIHLHEMDAGKISDFEKITPLKWSEILAHGSEFPTVYEDLRTFIGDCAVVVMLGDGAILKQDCVEHKVTPANALVAPTRLKPILCEVDEAHYTKIWSGMLYQEVGVSLDHVLSSSGSSASRSEHDGLFDATSMAIFVDTIGSQ